MCHFHSDTHITMYVRTSPHYPHPLLATHPAHTATPAPQLACVSLPPPTEHQSSHPPTLPAPSAPFPPSAQLQSSHLPTHPAPNAPFPPSAQLQSPYPPTHPAPSAPHHIPPTYLAPSAPHHIPPPTYLTPSVLLSPSTQLYPTPYATNPSTSLYTPHPYPPTYTFIPPFPLPPYMPQQYSHPFSHSRPRHYHPYKKTFKKVICILKTYACEASIFVIDVEVQVSCSHLHYCQYHYHSRHHCFHHCFHLLAVVAILNLQKQNIYMCMKPLAELCFFSICNPRQNCVLSVFTCVLNPRHACTARIILLDQCVCRCVY